MMLRMMTAEFSHRHSERLSTEPFHIKGNPRKVPIAKLLDFHIGGVHRSLSLMSIPKGFDITSDYGKSLHQTLHLFRSLEVGMPQMGKTMFYLA